MPNPNERKYMPLTVGNVGAFDAFGDSGQRHHRLMPLNVHPMARRHPAQIHCVRRRRLRRVPSRSSSTATITGYISTSSEGEETEPSTRHHHRRRRRRRRIRKVPAPAPTPVPEIEQIKDNNAFMVWLQTIFFATLSLAIAVLLSQLQLKGFVQAEEQQQHTNDVYRYALGIFCLMWAILVYYCYMDDD